MIIAHRGASFDAPENTMAAVNLAWRQNADAVEVDVHVTRDEQIVVIHDNHTGRTGDVHKIILDYSLSHLRKIDMGRRKGEQWAGERIPTLEEVWHTVNQHKKLFIEIKGGRGCLPPIKKIIEKKIIPDTQIVLMDFDLQVISEVKKTFPNIEALFLHEFDPESAMNYRKSKLNEIIITAQKHNLDGVNVENVDELNAGYIKRVKNNNLKIYCWTVNEPKRAAYLLEAGIDGIATDRPGWLRESLGKL